MLADFGSRLTDDSEWDEPEDDDPLELNELFNFEALTNFPVFNFQDFSQMKMRKFKNLQQKHTRWWTNKFNSW